MPGDVTRVVAQEIGRVELRPQLCVRCSGIAYSRSFSSARFWRALQPAARGFVVAREQPARRPRTDPRAACPSTRSRPSGWCRECRRPSAGRARSGGARRRPCARNAAMTAGSRHVLLLRGRGHHQMLLDQPRDQLGVFAASAVLRQKRCASAHAEHRVVAAAPLGDVVEQTGEVEHFRSRSKSRDQPAAQRIFVRISVTAKRRRLRITIRMCSSTV